MPATSRSRWARSAKRRCSTRSTSLPRFQEGLRKNVGVELKQRLERVLDDVGRAQVGPLRVHRERVILQPGERRAMVARFELPDDIKPARHYRALLELYNATLTVDIYTTEKAGTKETL